MLREAVEADIGTVVLLVIIAVIVCILKYVRRNHGKKLPPGPYGLPIVGYLPWLRTKPYEKLVELGKKYGPVYSLRFGSRTAVMICDYSTMKSVLNRDSTMGRPPDFFLGMTKETIALGAIDGYGWKEQKKYALHKLRELGFGTTQVEIHIREEIEEVLERIESEGGRPIHPVQYFVPSTSNNISSYMFGKRRRFDDPKRILWDQLADRSREMVKKVAALSFFPFIKNISVRLNIGPQNEYLQTEALKKRFFQQEIKEHQKTLDPNNVRDFIDGYLLEIEKKKSDPYSTFKVPVLEDVVSLFFGAGSEALRVALDWLILEAAAFPEVQKRVQSEIDSVIGRERFPSRSDFKQMPFTEAVILENYRWRASLPINIPRYTLEDIYINSYFVPKNTQIIAVFWAVNRDPKLWGNDVDSFRPERFLSNDGKEVQRPEYLVPFSIGRRSCPGEALANVIVFMYFTAILQKFHLRIPNGAKADLEESIAVGLQTKQNKICFELRE